MEDQAVCCYRHPERETGISCTRCDRPICPSCMVSASVGFQCPECVSGPAGASAVSDGSRRPRATGAPRTLAGGPVAEDPRLVTKALMAINIGVWIAVLLMGDRLVNDLSMISSWPPGNGQEGVAEGQWYRLFTAVFLHQEPMHIAFNMLSLWWLGPPLEAAFGRARYLALYLLSGLGGSVLSYLVADQSAQSLGASGAIFGLLGATAVVMRKLNHDMRPVAVLLALNLLFTFTWGNIAWQAHIGGLITGIVVAYGLVHAPRDRRALVQGATCALVLLALVVLVIVRTFQLTG
ncbi:rhomboid family intramembrane serine protease [Streptomyces palmae]|uniref:Rhomboid family intramembrane serine protease n=1 Tax=Streptomyces palmae TaxID=1701085 RepID=A0A4Z0GGG6_9ACTN|nr:rhomboid family intramembrane serine protease [Streptomyces palmae]TGA95598.1 rhomboid family intramembrane serine protease [Streptomyces palmae]